MGGLKLGECGRWGLISRGRTASSEKDVNETVIAHILLKKRGGGHKSFEAEAHPNKRYIAYKPQQMTDNIKMVSLEFLTAESMKMAVFWL